MMENLAELEFEAFVMEVPQKLTTSIESNLSLRMKYPTETDKFYSSQENIHEILVMFDQKLEETEEVPQEVMKMLISSKVLVPFLKTLEHPNLDINIAAVTTFHCLIIEMNEEIEKGEENAEHIKEEKQKGLELAFPLYFRMVVWMIQNGLIQSLFSILNKVEEEKMEEYESGTKILKIIHHLIELSQTAFPILVKETRIVQYIANRILPNFKISHRVIDDNKFVASDLLLALLQTPEITTGVSAVRQLFECCGVQVLITTISAYENNLPTEIDEREFLINIFDCLNILVVSIRESRPQVHQMRGAYLLVTYICNKTQLAIPSLKILSNSLDNEFNQQFLSSICEEIVNDGSLKYLLPILKGQGIKGKDEDEQLEINENILIVIYFLVRNSEGVARDRILYKFTEKRFEKLERIFQLVIENGEYAKSQEVQVTAEEYLQMIKEDNLVLVELCHKILLTLWGSSKKIQQRMVVFFNLYGIHHRTIQAVIKRNYKFIDEGQEKLYLERLISTNLRQIQQLKFNKKGVEVTQQKTKQGDK